MFHYNFHFINEESEDRKLRGNFFKIKESNGVRIELAWSVNLTRAALVSIFALPFTHTQDLTLRMAHFMYSVINEQINEKKINSKVRLP